MDPTLRRYYLQYNRRYFGGKLPRDLEVVWKPMRPTMFGRCWTGPSGPHRIEINERIKPLDVLWRGTLIHEMAHAKLPWRVQHGPKFDAEMLRLAKLGALKGIW